MTAPGGRGARRMRATAPALWTRSSIGPPMSLRTSADTCARATGRGTPHPSTCNLTLHPGIRRHAHAPHADLAHGEVCSGQPGHSRPKASLAASSLLKHASCVRARSPVRSRPRPSCVESANSTPVSQLAYELGPGPSIPKPLFSRLPGRRLRCRAVSEQRGGGFPSGENPMSKSQADRPSCPANLDGAALAVLELNGSTASASLRVARRFAGCEAKTSDPTQSAPCGLF